jgi:type IV fimbrial biogenesis protein FimT
MQHSYPARPSRRTRGVTLVEALCAISIFATSVGLAMPSLKSWKERQALLSAAAELETDIQYARSHAVAHNTAVHLTVRTTSEGACYVMHTGETDACTCTSDYGPVCNGGNAHTLRYSAYPEHGIVKLLNRNTTLTFNPRLGTVTPAATFKLKAPSATVHQIVSIMGRTRSCSPDGIPGTRAC